MFAEHFSHLTLIVDSFTYQEERTHIIHYGSTYSTGGDSY